jgi:hypothetical protein
MIFSGLAAASLVAASSLFLDAAAFAPVAKSAIKHSSAALSVPHRRNTALPAFIATSEDAPRNIQPLEEWCTQYGVQKIDGIQLYTEDGLDYQMITTADIPAGTTILYVPGEMVLSSDRVAQELNSISDGGLDAAVQQLGRIGGASSIPKFYLFLKILMEYEMQENSSFLPYLDAMPRLYYCAVSMTDFCYECLPPLVFNLSRTERVKVSFSLCHRYLQLLNDVTSNRNSV